MLNKLNHGVADVKDEIGTLTQNLADIDNDIDTLTQNVTDIEGDIGTTSVQMADFEADLRTIRQKNNRQAERIRVLEEAVGVGKGLREDEE